MDCILHELLRIALLHKEEKIAVFIFVWGQSRHGGLDTWCLGDNEREL